MTDVPLNDQLINSVIDLARKVSSKLNQDRLNLRKT